MNEAIGFSKIREKKEMKTDTKKLFQITEAAHACGLSRSTLMRMEEKGMLTPAFIAPNSGRRYYDNHNVARILQIEKFKAMGLDPEEVSEYFIRGGDVSDLLAVLEVRLHDIQRSVEEMRLRAGNEAGMSVQIITLPAVTCCVHRCEGHTIAEKYAPCTIFTAKAFAADAYFPDEPLFTISELTGFSGRIHRQRSLSVFGVRSGKNRKRTTESCTAAGMPGIIRTLLRRL